MTGSLPDEPVVVQEFPRPLSPGERTEQSGSWHASRRIPLM